MKHSIVPVLLATLLLTACGEGFPSAKNADRTVDSLSQVESVFRSASADLNAVANGGAPGANPEARDLMYIENADELTDDEIIEELKKRFRENIKQLQADLSNLPANGVKDAPIELLNGIDQLEAATEDLIEFLDTNADFRRITIEIVRHVSSGGGPLPAVLIPSDSHVNRPVM